MNRERFEQLLDAYGADFRRWPEAERAQGEAFASANDVARQMRAASALDGLLDAVKVETPAPELLAKRILAKAPRATRPVSVMRVGWALAACAVFGIVLGYGGGMLAPVADDDDLFVMAFEAPSAFGDEG